MAGGDQSQDPDPWATWGGPQQEGAQVRDGAPLPDSPEEQGDPATTPAPDPGADSGEWHRDDWAPETWWSRDNRWSGGGWWQSSWDAYESPQGRWEWRHGSGTESTRDSDHGSEGGQWHDRRVSGSFDDHWSRGSWNRASESGQHSAYGDNDNKKATLSERMAVPSFTADSVGNDLGASARSYLRQIDAWVKVTRAPKAQQALLLYQHLQGRAWVESEELCVDDLALDTGVQTFKQWISDRYQEVEISKVAETLSYFFKKLRRQPGQSIREFNSLYDRAHTRGSFLNIMRLPDSIRCS